MAMKELRWICPFLLLAATLLQVAACATATRGPAIMTWAEYAAKSSASDTFAAPYVVRVAGEKGSLLFFGASHTTDLGHHQFNMLVRLWREFKPTVAFGEGRIWPLAPTPDDAIRRYGEQGLLRFLSERDRVRLLDSEPNPLFEFRMLRLRYPASQIKVYYILRQVNQHRRMELTVPLEVYIKRVIDQLSQITGARSKPTNLEEFELLARLYCPSLKDWRRVPSSWFASTVSVNWTNELQRRVNDFRNLNFFNRLCREVRKGERVFVLMGFTHAVMLEPALRQTLSAVSLDSRLRF